MTVRAHPEFYEFIYDHRGEEQFYANPIDEFRGYDDRVRSDPRDNIPGYGMFDIPDNRQRDNDYRDQRTGGYTNAVSNLKYTLVPELRTSEGLTWYFGNYDVFDGMR